MSSICTAAGRSSSASVSLVLILTLALVLPASAEWSGTESLENNVLVVSNPGQGMLAPLTIELEELWRVGGETDEESEFFGIIRAVETDPAGNVYLLDEQLGEIRVFSPDGEYMKTIGREGEGPGEFRRPSGMTLFPDGNIGVVQRAPARIVLLTPNGDPAGDFPTPTVVGAEPARLRDCKSAADNLYLILQFNQFDNGTFTQTLKLVRTNHAGEIAADFCEGTRTLEFANAVFDETSWDSFENRWAVGSDGTLYAAETWGEYAISVWSPDGRKERVIRREYTHRSRSRDEIDELRDIFSAFIREVPDSRLEISDYDHDIASIHARDGGSLWVLHSHGASLDLPEGTVGIFDVFDHRGRYVREVTLKGDGDPFHDAYFFVGDRLFIVTDLLDAEVAREGGRASAAEDAEEIEPMSVICYRVDKVDDADAAGLASR